MLEDDNKRFVIRFFCLWYQHGLHVFVFGFSWEWLQTKNKLGIAYKPLTPLPHPHHDKEGGEVHTIGLLEDQK
jgi:hypothetical protein